MMTWGYAYTPAVWPFLLTAACLFGLVVYSQNYRHVPGAVPFALGSLFAALWITGTALEVVASDVPTKIFWLKVQAIWQLPALTAVTCFIVEYTWPGRWLSRRNLALLSIPPLLVLVLVLTNEFHHLIWLSSTVNGIIKLNIGPAVWLFIAYTLGLGVIEIIAFIWLFVLSPPHRWPVFIMLTGQIGARAMYLLEVSRQTRTDPPYDTLAVVVVFLAYAIALFGFRLFDPVPLARRSVLLQMSEGVLVLDPQGRVTSLNPASVRILGRPSESVIGLPIQEFLPTCTLEGCDLQAAQPGQTEISLGEGSETRYYLLTVSSLKDWRGMIIGCLLLLHDVTGQKQAILQTIEQQRAQAMLHEREQLARELHDSLGQVFAFVNAQGQAARLQLRRGNLRIADSYLDRLIEAACEADVDIRESILGLRVTLFEQGLFPALAQYLSQYEKNYGIHTRLEKPETFADGTFDPLVEVQLMRILQEALTNVRKHAGASQVWISFARENGYARVRVQDDGHGFAPGETAEDPRKHIGLRVMRERAEEVGGHFNLRSEPGQGMEVLVWVPVKGEGDKEPGYA